MSALESTVELSQLLDRWGNERPEGEPLIQLLTRIAEVLEEATETYFKQDPDPFDDRHPCRANPDCALGHMLKKVVRNEEFISALCVEYLSENSGTEINTVSCRILLDLTPGLDTGIFDNREGFVNRLIMWAERAPNPLRSYAIAVLAVVMEDEDISRDYKEQNACLVTVIIERLQDLSEDYFKSCAKREIFSLERPFAHLNKESKDSSELFYSAEALRSSTKSPAMPPLFASVPESFGSNSRNPLVTSDLSSSSWSDMESLMIGTHQVYPLTLADEQRYIVQYLTSVGEYNELMNTVYSESKSTIDLLLKYADLNVQPNVRLAFDALKLIAVLLSHKKCALDFISKANIDKILSIYRPSLAATGVSYVLYYLVYNEDALQKLCLLPKETVWNLVSYGLWLLECSHATGRANAVVFFGSALQYDVIRVSFSEQDGLRKLLNVISTLEVVVQNLTRGNRGGLSVDAVTSSRHMCRHVCATLKRLYESYAESMATYLLHSQPESSKALYNKKSLEENVETILKHMPNNQEWEPAEQMLRLDGISLLLKLIVMNFDWGYSGKVETIRNSLDVLYVCSVSDKVKLAICDSVSYLSTTHEVQRRAGMSIILQAAHGEVLAEGDVRRSALNVIVNCVCKSTSPFKVPENVFGKYVLRKKVHTSESTERMNKIWNCVRANNGIMVLCGQLTIKSPVTDADAIRSLACQALCGLANCPKVMQIISKLPLVTSGVLQVLMQEPILSDKRQEHAKFVHYCKKLMEMVVGRSVDSLISNLNKAEIVSQTVISYNEEQLLQLIAEYLYRKGYTNSASVLQKEAALPGFKHYPSSSLPSSSKCAKACKRPTSFEKLMFSPNICSRSPLEHMSESHQVSLDSIVTEYLRNQHSLCKNPYVTCPPFDLFMPHQCSEPSARNVLPNNISARFLTKQHCPSHWGRSGASMLRKYLSSRFQDIISIVDPQNDDFTACGFLGSEKIYVGTCSGAVRVFKVETGEEIYSLHAHETALTNIQFRKNSPLFLTSALWRRPISALWNSSEHHQLLYQFNDECYAEFSKLNQDRIIGTKYNRAQVYDVETGSLVMTLEQHGFGNSYRNNRATFNYTDDLILSDGVIWDVRSERIVHKLDKFNSYINGVFHPNCVEIVSNSEIWDARTYRLLRTVPELEKCKILFDNSGDVIYGAIISRETDKKDDACFKRYGTSIRTFDASGYTCLATKDIQKGVYDIALDSTDRYLAVIQKPVTFSLLGKESICHIYEIGCSKEGVESDDDDLDDLDDLDDESQEIQHSDEDEEEEDEEYHQNDDEQGEHEGSDREHSDSDDGSNDESESTSDNTAEEDFYFSFVT